MEKRRRARINSCLNELKGILLEAMRKDPARHSKLEKADILELTVRHLQNIQRNQLAIAMASDPTVLHRFKNGFSECATEVIPEEFFLNYLYFHKGRHPHFALLRHVGLFLYLIISNDTLFQVGRYVGRLDGVDQGIRQRLSGHLGACVNGLQQVGPMAFGPARYAPLAGMPFNLPPSPAQQPSTHSVLPLNQQTSATTITAGTTGLVSPPSTVPQCGDMNNNGFSATINPTATSTVTSSSFDVNRTRRSLPFAITPRRPPTPPPSPPSRFEEENPNEKGTNTVPRNRRNSCTSAPLDFSVCKLPSDKVKPVDRGVRIGKVEPMVQAEADSSGSHRDNMWRPW